MSGSMSKLGLDAVIQRDVAEDTRNSAFARSETALQLSWVVGGAFGLLPMPGWFGFTLGSVFVIIAFLGESASLRRARLYRRVEERRAGVATHSTAWKASRSSPASARRRALR